MVFRVTYYNVNGSKRTDYFSTPDFRELLKWIASNDERFFEVLEVKCVVRDFVEELYDAIERSKDKRAKCVKVN